jgi:ABC-type spermidine/putrescine transport system permease subunit I
MRLRAPAATWWLALPAAAFLLLAFALPFLGVARVAVAGEGAPGSGTFVDLSVLRPANLRDVAADPLFGRVVAVTLRIAVLVTAICTAVAVPFAAYVHTRRGWRRGALVAAVAVPKLVNLLVLLYGVLLTLGRGGVLNDALVGVGLVDRPLPLFGNLAAVLWTEVLVVLPYPVLLLVAAFSATDGRQVEAARSLGAGPVRAYYEVVIRSSWPAIGSAATIAAVWAAGAFVGPLVLGNPPYYTVAVEVYTRALERLAWVEAAGWSLLGVGVLAACLLAPTALARAAVRR